MRKPKIYKRDNHWYCACRFIIGMGETVYDAFCDWKKYKELMS